MSNPLKILINAQIDQPKAFATVNKQIDALQTAINKKNIKINIGVEGLEKVTKQIEGMKQNIVKTGMKDKSFQVFDVEQLKKDGNIVHRNINEAVKAFEKFGNVNITKNLDPATKQVKDFTLQVEKAGQIVEKVKFKPIQGQTGNKVSEHFLGTSLSEIDKSNKYISRVVKETESLRREMSELHKLGASRGRLNEFSLGIDKASTMEDVELLKRRLSEIKKLHNEESKVLRERRRLRQELTSLQHERGASQQQLNIAGTLISSAKDEAGLERAQQQLNNIRDINNTLINQEKQLSQERLKTHKAQEKTVANANKQADAAKRELETLKQNAQFRVQDLKSQFRGNIDHRALDEWQRGINALTDSHPRLRQEMDRLNGQLKQITSNARAAASEQRGLLGQFQQAATRIPIWMAGMTAMYAPLRMMQQSISQILEVDRQMTVLKRVSNGQEDINKAMEESIRLADELGNKMININDAVTGFARQGYRGDDLFAMAEVATLMSNVSELPLEDSMSRVTAAMKVFNIEAEDSIRIVDSLNEVNTKKSASFYSNVV